MSYQILFEQLSNIISSHLRRGDKQERRGQDKIVCIFDLLLGQAEESRKKSNPEYELDVK